MENQQSIPSFNEHIQNVDIANTSKIKTNQIIAISLGFIVLLLFFLFKTKQNVITPTAIDNSQNPSEKMSIVATIAETKKKLPEFHLALTKDQAAKIRNHNLLSSDQEAFITEVVNRAQTHLNKTPNPIKTIQMEGKSGNDPGRLATVESLKDIYIIYDLGFAYLATEDKSYLDKAQEYLTAWAQTNVPTGNPINEDHLYPLFRGYDMVRGSLDTESRTIIDAWLTNIAKLSIDYNLQWQLWKSNWNTHRLNVITQIGYLLNNPEFKLYAQNKVKEQIYNNLNADGSSFDYIERDAMHYHLYNLEALLHSAYVFKLNNIDMYNYTASNGASIKNSVDFVLPYVTGEKTHKEFVNSKAAYDRGKGSNLFSPTSARYVLDVNYLLTGQHLELVRSLSKTNKKYPSFEEFLPSL